MKILPIIFAGFLLTILVPNSIYAQSNDFVTSTITLSDEYLVTDFDIPSSLVMGGEITSYKIYSDFKILVLELNTWEDGQLTIILPRTLIDAVLESGEDDDLFVLVDGTETEFKETRNISDRTVTVSFSQGTKEIMIFGTYVIPEFNELAIMVLGGLVLFIVIISKKLTHTKGNNLITIVK